MQDLTVVLTSADADAAVDGKCKMEAGLTIPGSGSPPFEIQNASGNLNSTWNLKWNLEHLYKPSNHHGHKIKHLI